MAKAALEKQKVHSEGKGLIALGSAFCVLLCLLSFEMHNPANNWLGLVGWGIAWGLNWAFGLSSYLFVGFAGYLGWNWLLGKEMHGLILKGIYFSLLVISSCLLLNLLAERGSPLAQWCSDRVYTESLF